MIANLPGDPKGESQGKYQFMSTVARSFED
jgi:hypothetical protein